MKTLINEVDDKLGRLRLPQMREPAGLNEDYDYPSDVGRLLSHELGALQLKLAGWYTYLLGVIGREEAELAAIETAYNIRLGVRVQEIADTYAGRKPAKETLQALAIQQDKNLSSATRVLMRKKMFIRRLTAQADIYREQKATLSREQSRRESEARAM